MLCSKCGAPLEEGNVFCPGCGAVSDMAFADSGPVEEEPAETLEAPPETEEIREQPEEETPKMPVFVWYLGVALLIAMVMIIMAGRQPASHITAVENYIAVRRYAELDKIERLAPEGYWAYMSQRYVYGREALKKAAELIILQDHHRLKKDLGEDAETTYKIVEDAQVDTETLDKIRESLAVYSIAGDSVMDAHEMQIVIETAGSISDARDRLDCYAICIDGVWYLSEKISGGLTFYLYTVRLGS